MRPKHAILVVSASLALAACTIYRPEIRQGNFLKDELVAQVKPGMTRSQVEFLLGKPMVADPFHPDRWDYIFTVKLPSRTISYPHVVVLFDGDKVAEVRR